MYRKEWFMVGQYVQVSKDDRLDIPTYALGQYGRVMQANYEQNLYDVAIGPNQAITVALNGWHILRVVSNDLFWYKTEVATNDYRGGFTLWRIHSWLDRNRYGCLCSGSCTCHQPSRLTMWLLRPFADMFYKVLGNSAPWM
jgi:hypothetical protein